MLAAGLSWLFPQLAAVVAGGAILIALAWRKQERAVTAIEERDGVRYYVVPGSPFKAIELVRTGRACSRLRSVERRRPAPSGGRALAQLVQLLQERVFATCVRREPGAAGGRDPVLD